MISQLNQDINYCTRVLGCNAEQTDELISSVARNTFMHNINLMIFYLTYRSKPTKKENNFTTQNH